MDDDLALFDATCHAKACPNEGITVRVPAAATNPIVVCGAHVNADGLNERITDVVPVAS